ncbi:Ferrichrome-iron receptor precursor [Vibrio ruber DSM 16370]|uniref:Ferrichrome-iron receptor n=2 Tax=Vibrio ruber TaxID=184755 RepID=A0A1R4LC98_VIBR1|nr:Ferrichrome-iron receptor precursor [Vibrio ruber DSM 16370]
MSGYLELLSSEKAVINMNKIPLAQIIRALLHPRNVLVLGFTASPVFAATNETDQDNADVIVVTGSSIKQTLTSNIAQSTMRTEADLTEIPRSAVVLNRDLLEQQNAVDMSDVLSNISNVSKDNDYGGTRDEFTIRGFKASVYEDGTRIYGLASDKAVLEDIEYVEVVKGPESILYGNMNPGGLINLIGKKPEAEQSSQVSLNLDEHGKRRVSFDSTGAVNEDGSLLYRLVGVADDSEGWRDDSDSRQTYIAPSLTWIASEDTRLTFSYKYNKEKVPFDRGTLAVLNSSNGDWRFLDIGSKRLGAGFSSQERTTQKWGLDIEHYMNDMWTTRLKLRHQKRDYDGTRVHFYASSAASRGKTAGVTIYGQDQNKNVFDGTINRYIGGENTSSRTDVISWENQLTFDIGQTYHQITTGVDATRYKEDKTTSVSASWSGLNTSTTVYSGRFLGTADPNSGAYDYNSDHFTNVSNPNDMFKIQDESQTLTEYGIYLNDLIEYGDWHFVAGLRADRYSRKHMQSTLPSFKGSETKTPYETNVSGQLGALYQFTDNVSGFSNIATSYMPNDKYDSVANHWVDSQKGTQYEIGTKLALLDKNLNLTFSTYRIDLDNVAYKGDVTGSYDVYKQRSRGFEIDGDYTITDQLTAIFSYGYTDVEFVNAPDTTAKPVNVPDHNASAWLFYDINEQWGAGTGVVYVGERAGNRRQGYDYTLDAYTLVNMTAWYQPAFADKNLRVQLSVANLFDKDYYASSSDSSQNAVYLGSPRTVSLKANYKF